MSKSPVYGMGRNKKHKPQGVANHPSAANINMKGKKHKRMSCGCCSCVDFREDMIKDIHNKEMNMPE